MSNGQSHDVVLCFTSDLSFGLGTNERHCPKKEVGLVVLVSVCVRFKV